MGTKNSKRLLSIRVTRMDIESGRRRLEAVEATLSVPERFITREQASRISQVVRAIGLVMSQRSGRNEYGVVLWCVFRSA